VRQRSRVCATMSCACAMVSLGIARRRAQALR
jgi:hypothetical protein